MTQQIQTPPESARYPLRPPTYTKPPSPGPRPSTVDLVLQAAELHTFDWLDIGRPDLIVDGKLRSLLGVESPHDVIEWNDLTARIHDDERPAFERHVLQAFANHEPVREEVDFIINGSYQPVEITAVVSGGGDIPLRLTGSIRVRRTNYRRQEETAALAHRLKLVVDATRVGVWDWVDMAKEDVDFSPCLLRLLGYDHQSFEMTLDRFWNLIHVDDAEGIRAAVVTSSETRGAFDINYRILFANRGYRWVRSMGTVSINPDGTQRLTGAIADIHEQVTLRERLQQILNQQRLAVTASNSGIWDWRDIEKKDVYMSSGMLQLLGYGEQEVEQTVDKFWDLIHPADHEETKAALERSLADCRPFKTEHRMRFASGQYGWIRSTAMPVKDAEGKVVRLTGSIADISLEMSTKLKLRDQAKMYEREFKKLSDQLLDSLRDIECFCSLKGPSVDEPLSFIGVNDILADIGANAQRALGQLREARLKMNIFA